MNFLADILRQHTELAIFLALAMGFLLGRIKIGSFKVGSVLGCLFAGMLIGQLDIQVAPVVKIIFFDLFLFATGYKVGPQFFRGLKKDAIPQLILTAVICVSCLATAILVAKVMHYDVGTAAGMLAGAFTESTVIGTAADAIQRLGLSDAEKAKLINNIPIAYAVTYLAGTTTLVWLLSSGLPWLMRFNLRSESRKLEETMAPVHESDNINAGFNDWSLRAIRVKPGAWHNKTIEQIQQSIPDARIIVGRVRKPGGLLDPVNEMEIQEHDVLAVFARTNAMLQVLQHFGDEVTDRELLDFPILSMELVVTQKTIAGKTLLQLGEEHGEGIMLNRLVRTGLDMPFEPNTEIHSGDILHISGRKAFVERAAKAIGFKELSTADTDMIFVGMGIVLGGFVGLLSLELGGIMITLSTSGGALLMGLIFGWLHSKTPAFGRIPEAALWIFDNMGLATFLAIVGLAAGPSFVSGIKQTGFGIIPAGLIVAVVPHIIGWFAGRYLLKMNPVILLGSQCGAGTTTTALKAVQEAAGSKLPVLGYTIPYALGNILLTAWGPVIVSIMT